MSDDIKTRLGDVIGGAPATPEVIEDAYAEIVVLQAEVDREREKIEALRAALHEALPVLEAAQAHIMVGTIGTLNALAKEVHALNRGEGDNATRIAEFRKLTEGP